MSNEKILADLEARIGSPSPPKPTLRYRSEGPEVQELQQQLEKAGVYSIAEGDDVGLFGRATEQAVRAFQLGKGLRPDALVGPLTWAALLL